MATNSIIKRVFALPDAAETLENSRGSLWGWMFWLDGVLHVLFLIVVLIALLRS